VKTQFARSANSYHAVHCGRQESRQGHVTQRTVGNSHQSEKRDLGGEGIMEEEAESSMPW